MAKKILLINKSFQLGGIQIALANMLDAIHNEYDVTLAVFNQNGPFKDRMPSNVKLLELSPFIQVLGMSNSDCKKYGTPWQRIFKIVGSVWAKIFGNMLPINIALAFQKNVGEYDAVISYHQETSSKTLVAGFGKFALKKCKSPMKIAWVHADFLATRLATRKNLMTYQQFDKVIHVSETCMNSFITAYPSLKEKCDYCYNYIPTEEIIQKANAAQNVFERTEDTIVLFSACRLAKEKGLVSALESLVALWETGYDMKWYIAGEGPERKKLEALIKVNGLENKVVLLGFQNNPYPYIREADYLFLPSLHETFSMVVGEAHVLGTSVIASDIPIMREVLDDGDYLCSNGDFGKCIKDIKPSSESDNGILSQITNDDNWINKFTDIFTKKI